MIRTLWIILSLSLYTAVACGQTIAPSPYWKSEIVFPYDAFSARGTSKDSVKWVKFTILLPPYDPNVVYFQDSRKFAFHYNFAVQALDPFTGMTPQQFNAVTFYAENQQAVMGTVVLPPATGSPLEPLFDEYGIQFVRRDPYSRQEIRDMFHLVKANVIAPPEVQAFYFPTYEQQAMAEANRDWLASQGVPLGSTARWAKGNTCYAQGWALGRLRFASADRIVEAYHSGALGPSDILLTDGIPAELPYLAGIISLAPSTPNSHVAILARTYGVPFVHLALAGDAQRAQQLVGRRIVYSAYESQYGMCDVRLIDVNDLLDDVTQAAILELKEPLPLRISPIVTRGTYGMPTNELLPHDIQYVGGKASNFGLLQSAVPDNSPDALALTFDVWSAFVDQPLAPSPQIVLGPGRHIVLWADSDPEQGPTHVDFRLSRDGESIALYDVDGSTLIDAVTFGPQSRNVSFGRTTDGGDTWQAFDTPTPGRPNSVAGAQQGRGLVINEFMADNSTIEDPCEPGEYPDWIELYNASDVAIVLNGMYLTDDVNDRTAWQIRPAVVGSTLRREIDRRLSRYVAYPPADMQGLARDLAEIRSLFTDPGISDFETALRDGVLAALTDPNHGFDPNARLRFRSSTNVEDSADFIGAGLYESYSGCLADELDGDETGPCGCDPNEPSERGVFRAIRRVFASFYNDNAYLERLRHDVNEAQVGMAVLVHHSFPDEIELANGVATIERTGEQDNTIITLVTQAGAISVTNPRDASIPEELPIKVLPNGTIVPPSPSSIVSSSSLVPFGATVLVWRDEYIALADLLMRVSNKFIEATGKRSYVLDLEYKKVAPGGMVLPEGGLVIKQVRQVPAADATSQITPFLINVPLELEVFTGEVEEFEATDIFASHRLKSRWRLETYTMPLDANGLDAGLYSRVEIEYLDEDHIRTISQDMSLLPFAEHHFDGHSAIDTWRLPDLSNPRACTLRTTEIPTAVSRTENPIFTPADLGTYAVNVPYKCLTLDVRYDQLVTSWHQRLFQSDAPSGLRAVIANRVYLWPHREPAEDDVWQERSFVSDGISVTTSFYWPAPPATETGGLGVWRANNTAPLTRWDKTVIAGLASEPIVLRGYYSQTYRPEHHNNIENFLFEPRLEPGLSPDILAELQDRNVRFIHLILDNQGGTQSRLATYGFD